MVTCLYPHYIYHPYSRVLADKYRTIVTPRGVLHTNKCPYIDFKNLTDEEAQLYNILNPCTGELFPMLLQVSCGHCLLCSQKRANQWAYRCICETRTNGVPYFVTLTYSEDARPSDGVCKQDVQRFIKRLRTNLDRTYGSNNLRYVAVSEYTHSVTRRPHYHLLLWNIPDEIARTAYHRLKWIEKHWTQPTGKYNKDGSPVMSSNGYCYVLPCLKGGVNYVFKYMSKPSNVPDNQNKNFRLNSLGIGKDHINKSLSTYMANPSNLKENVYDIIRQASVSRPYTTYTKNKLYPSESLSQSPFFWKYLKKSISAYNIAIQMAKCLPPELHYLHVKFPEPVRKLFRKIRPLHVYSSQYIDENDYAYKFLRGFSASPQCTDHMLDNINVILHYAKSMFNTAMCDYDEKRLDDYLFNASQRLERKKALERSYADYQPNIEKLAYQAKKILFDYQRKEKF